MMHGIEAKAESNVKDADVICQIPFVSFIIFFLLSVQWNNFSRWQSCDEVPKISKCYYSETCLP